MQRYITLGQINGSPHQRFAVLDQRGHTVVQVQASRPDGIEVPRPSQLSWRVEPFIGGSIGAGWFNNCPPARTAIKDAAEKRQRGYAAGWARRKSAHGAISTEES